jgi:hypothetical protein
MVQGFYKQGILWSKDFIDRTFYGPWILDKTSDSPGFLQTGFLMIYRFNIGQVTFQGF